MSGIIRHRNNTVDISPCPVLSDRVALLLTPIPFQYYQTRYHYCWHQLVSCVIRHRANNVQSCVIRHRVTAVDISPCPVLRDTVSLLLTLVRVLCYQTACHYCWQQYLSCVIRHRVTTFDISTCPVLSDTVTLLLTSVRIVCSSKPCHYCWHQFLSWFIKYRVITVDINLCPVFSDTVSLL